jgi:hypothetical protein
MRGSNYLDSIVLKGNTRVNPDLVAEFHKVQQKIYFNPMSLSGNFKMRPHVWWSHRLVPTANVTSDILDTIYIDFDNSGNIYELKVKEDRIVGYHDYKELVESTYNALSAQRTAGLLTDEEFYDKLYETSVTVTIYSRRNNRIVSIKPDDLDSINAQEVDGILPYDRNYHIKMNEIYPKLIKVNKDIFKHYKMVTDCLFENCDRLTALPEGIFDYLTEQTTMKRWFASSGISEIDEGAFWEMKKVTDTSWCFYNSQIHTVPCMLFVMQTGMENMEECFGSCSNLDTIETTILRYTTTSEINMMGLFASCPNLKLDRGFRFDEVFKVTSRLQTYGMLRSVTVYNTDDELLDGLTTDGGLTLANYKTAASDDTTGLTKYTLVYRVLKDITVDEAIPTISTGAGVYGLTKASQLHDRIVIVTDDRTYAYDHMFGSEAVNELNIGNYDLHEGDMFKIDIYSSVDVIGVTLKIRNTITNEVFTNDTEAIELEFVGSLPYSTYKNKVGSLFYELTTFDDPFNFFKFYSETGYNISGIFENTLLKEVPDYIFASLADKQTMLQNAFKDCKRLYAANNFIEKSRLSTLESVAGLFDGCNKLISFSTQLFQKYGKTIKNFARTFKDCTNLYITSSYRNILVFNSPFEVDSMESMFENCKKMLVPIKLNSIKNCLTFERMYCGCESLNLTNKTLATITQTSDDITKFGRLSDEDYLPPKENFTDGMSVSFAEMFADCYPGTVYRSLYRDFDKSVVFTVDNMFRGQTSPFTDIFIVNGISAVGSTGVTTEVSEFRQKIRIKDATIKLNSILRYFGAPSSEDPLIVSKWNNLSYPELSGSATIDFGNGETKEFSISSKYSGKMKLHYKNITNNGKTVSGTIEINNRQIPDIEYTYDDSYVGQEVTISIKTSFMPLSVTEGASILAIDGELPWCRVEQLNLALFSNITDIPANLFKNCFVSTNTRIYDDLEVIDDCNVLFDGYRNLPVSYLTTVMNTLTNLRIIGPIFRNSSLISLNKDFFDKQGNATLMEYTMANNEDMEYTPRLPASTVSSHSVFLNTKCLYNADNNPLEGADNLVIACGIFAFCNVKEKTVAYKIFDPCKNTLKSIDYAFYGSNIQMIIDGFFKNLVNLVSACSTFENSSIKSIDYVLFPTAIKLRYIDRIFKGSAIESYNTTFEANTELSSCSYSFAECKNLTFLAENLLNEAHKLTNASHMLENSSKLPSVPAYLFANKSKLLDVSYSLKGCTSIIQVPSTLLYNSIAINNVSNMFEQTAFDTTPTGIFVTNTNIKKYNYLFKNNTNLVTVTDMGISVKNSDNYVNLMGMFYGCANLEWLYNKFSLFMHVVDGTKAAVMVEDMLKNILAKYSDEEMNENNFSLIGMTNSLFIPDPSKDTYNMNEMIYEFTCDTDIVASPYIYRNNTMAKFANIVNLVYSSRVIFDIDGDKVAYDKRLAEDVIAPINIPAGTHTVKVYTEGANDIVGDTTIDSDIVVLRFPKEVKVKLSGDMIVGPTKDGFRTVTFRTMYDNTYISDISGLNFITNPVVYLPKEYFKASTLDSVDLSNLPMKATHMSGMFSNSSNLTTVTMNTPNIYIRSGALTCDSMFANCPKLVTFCSGAHSMVKLLKGYVESDTMVELQLPMDFEKMFNNCTSLTNTIPLISNMGDGTKEVTWNSIDVSKSTIDCNYMYNNCSSLESIPTGWVDTDITTYVNTYPSYNFYYTFSKCDSLTATPINMLKLQSVNNATRFDYMFYNCKNLEERFDPICTMDWQYKKTTVSNTFDISHMFGLSTKYDIKRLKLRRFIIFENSVSIPQTISTYGMLENLTTYNTDSEIMTPYNYSGKTLAIYKIMGVDVEDFYKFTMYFEVKTREESYKFDIYGYNNTNNKYSIMTDRTSTEMTCDLILVRNGDLTDYQTYSSEVGTIMEPLEVSPMTEYDEGYEPKYMGTSMIRIDIYTSKHGGTITESLYTVRPVDDDIEFVSRYMLDGSIGYSAKQKSTGLVLTNLFNDEMKTKLTSVGKDLLWRYSDIGYASTNVYGAVYNPKYCLFANLSGLETLPEGIFDSLTDCTAMYGPFYKTNFNSLPDNLFLNMPKLAILQDLFAETPVPVISEEFLNNAGLITNMNGFMYCATNTSNADMDLLSKVPTLVTLQYGFYGSDLSSIHSDLLRFNVNLENVLYTFAKLNVASIPKSLFSNCSNLKYAEYTFAESTITSSPADLLKDKSLLVSIKGHFYNCTNMTSIGVGMVDGDIALEDMSYCFYNTGIKSIPTNLLYEATGLLNVNYTFALCKNLVTIPSSLFEKNVNITEAIYTFTQCDTITIAPTKLFLTLGELLKLNGVFQDCENLQIISEQLMPNPSKVRDITNMFYNDGNLSTIAEDFLKNQFNIVDASYAFGKCGNIVSFKEGSFDDLTGLEIADGMLFECVSLNTLYDGMFANSSITSARFMVQNNSHIKEVPNRFIKVKSDSTIELNDMFKNCINTHLYYKKIEDIIVNLTTQQVTVSNMFSDTLTFYDEDTVWASVPNKIGNSGLTHTDPVSTDTTGMNMISFTITAGTNVLKEYYIMSLGASSSKVSTSADLNGRVVTEIDGVLHGYDNVIYENEKVSTIDFTGLTGTHTVTIYTENTDATYYVGGMVEELNDGDTPCSIQIGGSFGTNLNNVPNITNLREMTAILELSGTPYSITHFDSTLLKNVSVVPRKLTIEGGFFSNLDITTVYDGTIDHDIRQYTNVGLSLYDGLFANCPNLQIVAQNAISGLVDRSDCATARKMFYNDKELVSVPNVLVNLDSIQDLTSFYENCEKLTSASQLITHGKKKVKLTRFFCNCKSWTIAVGTLFSEDNITNFDYAFYNTGITSVPNIISQKGTNLTSGEYAFSKTKITELPAGLFESSSNLTNVKYMFADCDGLVTVNNIQLPVTCNDITGLFMNCSGVNWGYKRVSSSLYLAGRYPRQITITDSFKGIPVELNTDEQLFVNMNTTGESNAIFLGIPIISTDTTGLNEFVMTLDPDNTESEYLYYLNTTTLAMEKVTSTSAFKSRAVIKVYDDSDNLLSEAGYDNDIFMDSVNPIEFTGKSVVKVYTKDDFVVIKGTEMKSVELAGTLPNNAFISNMEDSGLTGVFPLAEAFGVLSENDNIISIDENIMSNRTETKMYMKNHPFASRTLRSIGNIFKVLVDQEDLSYCFYDCAELMNVSTDIFKTNTKLTNLSYAFYNCTVLNLDIKATIGHLTELINISNMLANSGVTSYEKDVLSNNAKLDNVSGLFKNCRGLLEIRTLCLTPNCSYINELFYNCTGALAVTGKLVDIIYNGAETTGTVTLTNAFYTVSVSGFNEDSFTQNITHKIGSTGARFIS